jgi:hypothetical protein
VKYSSSSAANYLPRSNIGFINKPFTKVSPNSNKDSVPSNDANTLTTLAALYIDL